MKTRKLTNDSANALFDSPAWDSEGKGFYLLTDQGRDCAGLAYWPLDSSSFRWVETPNLDVEQFAASHEGTWLAWTENDGGYSRFHLSNLRTGARVGPGRLPDGVIRNTRFSNDGNTLLFTFSAADKPSDVWVYEPAADKMRSVTTSATGGLPSTEFRAPELVEYPTFDGRKVPAFWYAPAGTSKLPVVVLVHGGPAAQSRPVMSALCQYLLHRGYAVLMPNVRGWRAIAGSTPHWMMVTSGWTRFRMSISPRSGFESTGSGQQAIGRGGRRLRRIRGAGRVGQ